MKRLVTPARVMRRAGLLLLGICGLLALLLGAIPLHLYALEPRCWVEQWRAPASVGCQQELWFFGPGPVRMLAYLAGAFAVCVLLAWIMLSLQQRWNRSARR